MPKQIPLSEFKRIYSQVPRLCVDLVIRNEKGIVVSKRDINPGKGLWHLPGGTLLMGETIEEAAKRIALNETSLNIKVLKQIGVLEFPQEENMFRHAVSIVLLCEIVNGTLKGSFQGEEIDFFSEFPEPAIPEHKQFVEKLKISII